MSEEHRDAPRFDVFLSYNRADEADVERLARRLVDKGVRPWLDSWNLIPGDPWQKAIAEALGRCSSCAVFVGPSGLGPWQHEEMAAAIDRRVTAGGLEGRGRFGVIPVLLPGAERGKRSQLPAFLTASTWVEFRESLDDEGALQRLLAGIRGVEPGPGPGGAALAGTPYRGLKFFDVGDEAYYFGREAQTEWLLDSLRPTPRGENRFLALVGPSGSGKSSLARAGLLAALKKGHIRGSETWPAVVCRPGPNPLESLALALAEPSGAAQHPSALKSLLDDLATDERMLHVTARAALRAAPPEARLVLLVDQFEELFTLCRDRRQRHAFLDNLLYASRVAGGQALVIITLRTDFLGDCAAHPALAAAISDQQVLVGPMTDEELRRAIERPAQLAGGELQPGLAQKLLEEVKGQPGGLPLLQYALLELWERRSGRALTHAAYQEIGGVAGALKRQADQIYQSFSEAEKAACRQVLLRLTKVGEHSQDTRRRVPLEELLPAAGEQETARRVIRTLADARLLTTEGAPGAGESQVVEVAHEALIRNWELLREWIESDRPGLRTHRRLTDAAEDWEQNGRDDSYLFDGLRLQTVKEWAAGRLSMLNRSERDFLFHSLIHQGGEEVLAWVPRYGSAAETLALADEYLISGDEAKQLKGLEVLRALPPDSSGPPVASDAAGAAATSERLLGLILSAAPRAVAHRAA
ncbi:MAG TPA: TIR domain-containing protein [Pyrinomonadaceae bacterium]|nr:TIR domain-containing protein [Pyrinomonadaceae bacterium]